MPWRASEGRGLRRYPSFPAPTAAIAVMLTTRRTVADEVRMCTGRAAPSRIGPMVTPFPAVALSTLKRMFAASRLGITSMFAEPLRVVCGRNDVRISSDSAVSPWSSPSHSTSGACAVKSEYAARIFRAEGRSLEP